MAQDKLEEYRLLVSELLEHPKVREMEMYIQHGSVSCLSHCVYVSWVSWRLAKFLKLRHAEVARGALLHDMFLYDWHISKQEGLHAFRHPKRALNNAEKFFKLTQMERDIIERHMWPVTPALPKYAASYLVSFADKYCALMDTFGLNRRFISIERALLGRDKAND